MLVLLVLAIFAIPCIVLWFAVDDAPVVVETKALEVEDTRRARKLAKHAVNELLSGKGSTTVIFTERDLNGIMAMVSRGVPDITGRINIAGLGLVGALTYSLPGIFKGRYLNIQAGLQPASRGIRINRLSVGRLTISGDAALWLLRLAGDLILGDQQGTLLVNSIESVAFNPGEMVMHLNPPRDLRARVRQVGERFKDVRDEVAILGDPAVVKIYYDHLVATDAGVPPDAVRSMDGYFATIFGLTHLRSLEGDPVDENQAAVLALTIYFGDPRFEKLIGPVRTRVTKSAGRAGPTVVLAGRRDLMLHFIISAGIKIAADSGISYAIGEFKELLDIGEGGSGFSFADLAAARAGVKFANVATDEQTARGLQARLALVAHEQMFFPSVHDLPEGISEVKFAEQYGGINGPGYAAIVAQIDQRIDDLEVYRQ